MNRILEGRKLTAQKWLNLYEITYLDPGGDEKKWQIASRKSEPKCISGAYAAPDAVVIVAYHLDRRQMVVTREYRVPLADYEYGLPAGLVDPGETPAQAAARELREETGLTATRIVSVGPPVYSSAGMTDESVAMVYLECDGTPSDAGNEGSEQIETFFLDPDGASDLCRLPEIKFDAKAWLVLTAFGQTGLPWPE